jgi:hypothetical protein
MFGFRFIWLLIATSSHNMTNNPLNQLINRLQKYQEWRRGLNDNMPDPKKVGEDIDAAIEVCKMMSDMLESKQENKRREHDDSDDITNVLDDDDGNHFF